MPLITDLRSRVIRFTPPKTLLCRQRHSCQAIGLYFKPRLRFFLLMPCKIMAQARNQWLVYAIASGGFAALNGVFAKLTTTKLTTTWATAISQLLGMDESSVLVEFLVRGVMLPMILDCGFVLTRLM